MKAFIILIIAYLVFGPVGLILALAGYACYWAFFAVCVNHAVQEDLIQLRKDPRL